MKPLTSSEIRDRIATLPIDRRADVSRMLASAWDDGLTAGLAKAARAMNPFVAATEAPEESMKKGRRK